MDNTSVVTLIDSMFLNDTASDKQRCQNVKLCKLPFLLGETLKTLLPVHAPLQDFAVCSVLTTDWMLRWLAVLTKPMARGCEWLELPEIWHWPVSFT